MTTDPSPRSGPSLRSGRRGGVHTVPGGAKNGWLNVINDRVGSTYARKRMQSKTADVSRRS